MAFYSSVGLILSMTLSLQEIAGIRSKLASIESALIALDVIEDCEGDLEDASITLAIQSGQQPDRTDWLEGIAKRCRVAICEQRTALDTGDLATVVKTIIQQKICPEILVTPAVLYALKQGLDQFCEPLSFKH